MNAPSAFSELRIVELVQNDSYSVPYATKLCADLGADVIMLETLDGHPLRQRACQGDGTGDVTDALFRYLASGKKSVVWHADGAQQAQAIINSADIVVTDFFPEEIRSRGLSVDGPGACVYVTPWGLTGPYRDRPASGLVLQAGAGWVNNRTVPTEPMVQVGGSVHEWAAGSYVAAAALTARLQARRTGKRVEVDFSMQECLHSTLPYTRLMADTNAEMGGNAVPNLVTPFGIRRCKDGWVGINILTGQQWADACMLTGLSEFTENQQAFYLGDGQVAEFTRRLTEWLAERTVNEIVELGQLMRIPIVPVADGESILNLRQWQERSWFTALHDPREMQRPGPPWRLSRTPAHAQRRAPRLGAQDELLIEESREESRS